MDVKTEVRVVSGPFQGAVGVIVKRRAAQWAVQFANPVIVGGRRVQTADFSEAELEPVTVPALEQKRPTPPKRGRRNSPPANA